MLKSLGATETLGYKLSQDELVAGLTKVTSGKITRIFDAVASNQDLVRALYQNIDGEKYFSTTNDWDPLECSEFNGANIQPVKLGPIGRPDATELNSTLSKLIPLMHHLLETGAANPAEYEVIGNTGFENVGEAWAYQQSGKAGSKKVVVKLQDV